MPPVQAYDAECLHFEMMQKTYAQYLTDDKVKPQFHRVGVNYKLTFNSEVHADDFMDQFNRAGHMWTDPRDGTKHPLRVRGDLPVDARNKRKAFSKICVQIKDFLSASPRWNPTCRLGVNGYKGILQVSNDEDIWELVYAKPSGMQDGQETYSFEPKQSELSLWNITPDQIEGIIKAALDDEM